MIINFRDLGSSGGGSDPRLTSSAFTAVDYVASAKTIYFYNLNGSVVGSIDATDFVVDGMVQDVYLSGNTLVIEFNTESGKQDINVDLSTIFNPDNYWTSAQTQSAITEAFASAKTYTDTQISGATSDFVTSADVETQITAKGYITGYTETDPVFTGSPAYGITSNDITNWNDKLDASALTPYYTSAQTQSAITEAISTIDLSAAVASANTYTDGQVSALTAHLEDVEQVTASALTDLNTRIVALSAESENFVTSGDVETQITDKNYVTSGQVETQITSKNYITSSAITHMVESEDDSVVNVIKISQNDYDSLSAKSSTTLYVIIS